MMKVFPKIYSTAAGFAKCMAQAPHWNEQQAIRHQRRWSIRSSELKKILQNRIYKLFAKWSTYIRTLLGIPVAVCIYNITFKENIPFLLQKEHNSNIRTVAFAWRNCQTCFQPTVNILQGRYFPHSCVTIAQSLLRNQWCLTLGQWVFRTSWSTE